MKKLIATFMNDAKLSLRGLYFYIEAGMALIFIVVMLFVVPEQFENTQKMYLVDESPGQIIQSSLSLDDDMVELFGSREQLVTALENDRTAIGIVLSMADEKIVYEFVLQGFESDKMIATMKASIENNFRAQVLVEERAIGRVTLEAHSEKLTNREHILPIYLTLNVAMMGLFIIASYIFLDKDEGVIRAYAVTPVKIGQYLMSKVMVMLTTGVVTSLPVVIALGGSGVHYSLFVVSILGFSFFGSSLGLLISSFFNTMMKAMGALYVAIMAMMLPAIAYFVPAFNPGWIKWMPSYRMMFTFREILLRGGDTQYIWTSVGIFTALGAVLFVAATQRFKKTLTV